MTPGNTLLARLIFASALVTFALCPGVLSAYDYTCSSKARKLRNAADEYDSALSAYENTKSSHEDARYSYESACDRSQGHSRYNENTCGPYGYESSALESATFDLESARSSFESASSALGYEMSRVSRSCGDIGDGHSSLTEIYVFELRNVADCGGWTCLSRPLRSPQTK